MKVTPVGKKFGKYAPGQEFELPDKTAKVFVKIGKLQKVEPKYQTRMMTAEAPAIPARVEPAAEAAPQTAPESAPEDPAPYGYKADGTPRKRPGRPAASE